MLTSACEAFSSILLFPLAWVHCYNPLLPSTDYLATPPPFLFGCLREIILKEAGLQKVHFLRRKHAKTLLNTMTKHYLRLIHKRIHPSITPLHVSNGRYKSTDLVWSFENLFCFSLRTWWINYSILDWLLHISQVKLYYFMIITFTIWLKWYAYSKKSVTTKLKPTTYHQVILWFLNHTICYFSVFAQL